MNTSQVFAPSFFALIFVLHHWTGVTLDPPADWRTLDDGRRSKRNAGYKFGNVSPAMFEEDAVYDQKDAEGLIKLNALRLKLLARRNMR